MSRTRRRDFSGRTYNQYKNEMVKDFDEDCWHWYSSRGTTLKQMLGIYQTECMNYMSSGTKKAVKWHANKEQRGWDRNEFSKVYKDWDYHPDDRYCHRNYRIWWIYD